MLNEFSSIHLEFHTTEPMASPSNDNDHERQAVDDGYTEEPGEDGNDAGATAD